MVRMNAGRRRGARAAGCPLIAALLLLGCAGIAHGQGAGSAPSFAGACVPAEIWYREGVAIEPFTFPAATGGDGPLTYALWTPPGLSFDPATRRLTGTPDWPASFRDEVVSVRYPTKFKATDADGDADVASILFVVMADGYLPDRPSGTVIGDPCAEPAQMTGAFTDSTGRSIKYRLHYRKNWDLSQARGVELYFHGNSRGTEEQMLDWHEHWRPDQSSLEEGMLRAAVASPQSVRAGSASFFTTSLANDGTRSWSPADARTVHELLQSDFGGNAAVDRDRIVFTGDSQGPCFINYFLQRYAGVYGGGFHSNCGCLYWGSAWPPSTADPWSPTVQWTPEAIASVAPRFRIFVQSTTGDFLHSHSVAMRDMYRDVLGFETRWDLEAPGRHCAAGATRYSSIFEWLSQTPSLPRIHGTVAGDHDADGLADPVDPDDDNDGAPDVVDALPLEPREWLDTDADGIGDFLDADADGDGVPNATDPLPLDRSEWADNDADGIGDNIDADDDNDGISDAEDAQPLQGQRNDQLNFRQVAEFGLPPHGGSPGQGREARRHPARPSSIAYPQATGQSQSYYSVSLGDSGTPAFEIMVDSHHVRSEPCADILPAKLCASRHEGGFGFDEWDITFESQYRLIHIDRNQNRDLTDDGAPLVLADGGPDRSSPLIAGVSTILNVPYSTGARLPYRIGFAYLSAPDARERRLVYSASSYWIGRVSVPGAEPVLVGVFDANLDGLFNSGNYLVEEAITGFAVTSPEKLVDLKDYACVDIDRDGELDDCGDFTPFEEEDAFAPMFSGEPFMLDGVSCTLDIPPTGHAAQIDCADTAPDFAGAQPPGDRTYAVGAPIAALTLPEATGGDGALTYSLSPDVPGLTFDPATRVLGGTPSQAGAYDVTYTARDDDDDTDSLSFTITVEAADDHGDNAASATTVAAESDTPGTLDANDVDYFAITLAAAGTLEVYTSGGTDTYGHLEDAGGAQVARNDDSGPGRNFRISREVAAGTWYVRVSGYNGRVSGAYTLHARFTPADTSPSFSGSQANLSFTENSPISARTLPGATGGDGALTYSLAPSVPGLTFAADSRALGGTPTRAGTYSMTYTVRDDDNDTDSLSFTISVNAADTAPSFSTSQANLSYTENSPISVVDLPAATGGNGSLTYSLAPSVPGLTFAADSRALGGTPTRAGTYSMTYTVRDDDNDTDSLSFTISVNAADTAPSFSTSQANLSFTENSPISARTLPGATGGDGALTYSLAPSVPGLTFTPGTRRLSGTPTRAGTYRMTYTVADADNDTDSLSFTITVNAADTAPSFSTSQANLSYTENSPVSVVDLPAATGGNGSLTYSLAPSVPGLTFTAATRRLSGTPTRAGTYNMTYTVRDADNDTDSLSFTISVNTADTAPSFSTSQANLSFTENSPISARTLPGATGGDGALTYSLAPSVPGLTFTPGTRRLSGTPTRAGTYRMTYTVADADNDTDSLSFAISVRAAPTGNACVESNDVIEIASGASCEITQALVDKYSLGNVSISASTMARCSNGRVSVGFLSGVTVRLNGLTVRCEAAPPADTSPSFSGSQAGLSFTENSRISAVTLPAASGGDGALTYSLAPSVPGLTFTPGTRRLSGTPTRAGTYRMTYTVADADNDTDSLSFTISVNTADTAPSFSTSQANLSFTEDSPISARTLPGATGGDGNLTYSLSPSVPGLTFTPGTRRLSGTPTRAATYRMTYTVRDNDGDTDSLTFTITVNEATDLSPSFPSSQANLSFTEDTQISAVTLPAASGGDGALTYSLSPSVPGLTFTASNRRLSGTPTRAGAYLMTYTVRDADNDTDSLSFTISVNEADTSPSFSGSQADLSFIDYARIRAVTLPAASGGNGNLTYSLSPSVPGLTFTASNRRLSGSPTRVGAYSMTYTATDADNDTGTLSFTITVYTAPGFSGSQANLSFTEDSPISARTLPRATDGKGSLTYSLSPSVPGLTFTPGTRRLSGTPTRAGSYSMTYTVRDVDGNFDTLSFTITVNAPDAAPSFADAQFYDEVILTVNRDIDTASRLSGLTLPAASGGDGTLTYSLSPSVPGLAFAPSTRRLSGTPTRTGSYNMTYTATDEDDDTASLTFKIIVEVDTTPTFSSTQPDLTYTVGTPITAFTLPAPTGGNGHLVYTLLPMVPGLTFNLDTRRLSGTPTEAGTYSMELDAHDWDLDYDRLYFTITVNEADTSPDFSGSQANLSFTEDTQISNVTLPAAAGGNGSLTYSLSPSVPGLTFTAATRRLSGTPTRAGSYSMTYTATDADNDTDTLSFTIAVNEADTSPDFSGSQANLSFTEDTQISAVTLPTASGGNGALTYSLSPSVPGLTFTASNRRLSGTPTAPGTYNMTYTATDADNDTDTLSFTITVSAAPTGNACVESNDVIEIASGASCEITQALVDKYSLGNVSIRAGTVARCSNGRVSVGFLSGVTVRLNGLTFRCAA